MTHGAGLRTVGPARARPGRAGRACAAALGVLCGIFAGAPASAQDTADLIAGREHYARGVQLAREGDLQGALAEFLSGYARSRNPAMLFNIAAAHEQLNHYVDALEALERFEREAPPVLVARRRRETDAALGRLRDRIGSLVVALDLPGLVVHIDGLARPAADARAGLRLAVGAHRVRVSAPGYEPREVAVDVSSGAPARVAPELSRARVGLAVLGDLPGARVQVDAGEEVALPLVGPMLVTTGRHRVRVSRLGYEDWVREVDVGAAGATVAPTLEWARVIPREVGSRLVVRSNEPPVVAYLDGSRTSVRGAALIPPGPHTLRVERDGFLAVEQAIALSPGQRTTVDVMLHPTPAFRRQWLSSAGDSQRMTYWLLGAGVPATLGTAVWLVWSVLQWAAVNNELPQVEARLRACSEQGVCDPSMPAGMLLQRQEQLRSDYTFYLGQSVTAGVVAAAGLAVVVAGVVVAARSPDGGRFARPPVFRVGLGPGGVALSGSF